MLEKIRPIDQKLCYQIDKLVKTATEGVKNPTDSMSCKANLDNFDDKDDDEEEDEDDSDDDDEHADSSEEEEEDNDEEEVQAFSTSKKKSASKAKSGLYVAPKLQPVHYDGDETQAEKEKKMIDRAKRRALT